MTDPLDHVNSLDWFFADQIPDVGGQFSLRPDEAAHARGSKRLRPGEHLCAFDGAGTLGLGQIVSASGRNVIVRCADRWRVEPLRSTIVLAAALPKGDRFKVMLNMAVQLGMNGFIPLQCERGVAAPGRNFAAKARRICVEACKQCRRAHVPVISGPRTLAALADESGPQLLVAQPGRESLTDYLSREPKPQNPVIAAVGPEGGFTESELDAARSAGARIVSLSDAVLRIETAAAAIVAILGLARSSSTP